MPKWWDIGVDTICIPLPKKKKKFRSFHIKTMVHIYLAKWYFSYDFGIMDICHCHWPRLNHFSLHLNSLSWMVFSWGREICHIYKAKCIIITTLCMCLNSKTRGILVPSCYHFDDDGLKSNKTDGMDVSLYLWKSGLVYFCIFNKTHVIQKIKRKKRSRSWLLTWVTAYVQKQIGASEAEEG